MKPGRLRDLTASLHDAAAGLVPWNDALQALGEALGASGIVLFAQTTGRADAAFLGGSGFESRTVREYQEHFQAKNILLAEGSDFHHAGAVRTSETICSESTLLKSEYYNDFLRPHDIRYSAGMTILRQGDRAVHLSLFRPHGQQPFERRETRFCSRIFPHLYQAVRVELLLAQPKERSAALEQVVSRLGHGIALLTAAGEVVYANQRLQELALAGDGVTLGRFGLTCSVPAETQCLGAAVASASCGGPGGSLSVTRPSGRSPLSVVVFPLAHAHQGLGLRDANAAAIIVEPNDAARNVVLELQRLHGLTRAEARVAVRLAGGASVSEIASMLQISRHTARTHLKRVFAKTGKRGQRDLIRYLLLRADQ